MLFKNVVGICDEGVVYRINQGVKGDGVATGKIEEFVFEFKSGSHRREVLVVAEDVINAHNLTASNCESSVSDSVNKEEARDREQRVCGR